MSGEHWGSSRKYCDLAYDQNLSTADLPLIIEALGKVFHRINYDLSCDSTRLGRNEEGHYDENVRSESEKEIYDTLELLGRRLFGDDC